MKQHIFLYYRSTTNLKEIEYEILSWLILSPQTNQRHINIVCYYPILDIDFFNSKANRIALNVL